MLSTYVSGEFPEEYVPTGKSLGLKLFLTLLLVFTNYSKVVQVEGKSVKLGLWDTAGQEDYDRLRPLSYKKANIVMVCYSIDSPESLKHVQEKWSVEARTYAPTAALMLVGLKLDLREAAQKSAATADYYDPSAGIHGGNGYEDQYYLAEDGQYYPVNSSYGAIQGTPAYEVVDYETGKKMAVEIGAAAFKECSARTGENINETFDTMLILATRQSKPAQGCCTVM
jgi:GTPase SAR1 family protein